MTLGELINLARLRLDDLRQPYLWSDAQLIEFANAAVEEVADRTRCIRDNSDIPMVADTADYTVPNVPLAIHNIWIIDDQGIIDKASFASEAEFNTLVQFGNYSSSRPRFYAIGDNIANITLHPVPNTSGTIQVEYSRMPTEDERVTSSSDIPVVPAEMHRDMVYWMLTEAYTIRDADAREKDLAEKYEAKFDRRFGPKISGKLRTAARRLGVNKSTYPVRLGGI